MERTEFILKMHTAPATLDRSKLDDVAQGCIERLHDMRPDLPKGMLNMVGINEECGELIEAICRHIRGRAEDNYDTLQEMADVILDIMCVAKVLGIDGSQLVKAVNVKAEREAERIREHRMGHESK